MDLFPYPYANLSSDNEWNKHLLRSAARLFPLLRKIDLQKLPISDYQKKYLGNYLKRIHYGLETGIFILSHVFEGNPKSPQNAVLLDHGAGSGILSLLAKAAGVGTVIYEDIYDVSCHDASVLANHLGFPADAYVHGDEKAIAKFFKTHPGPDVVISRNVIEHVYRPEKLIETLASLHPGPLHIFFATTANPHNPAVNIYTRRLHHKVEKTGFRSRWDKDSDARKPMLQLRSEMIADLAPDFDEAAVVKLAEKTRGLTRPEISLAIEDLRSQGKYPEPISDPTNTCDPETGNWSERLTSISEYREIFEENGFLFNALPGFYDTHYPSASANALAKVLNPMIRILGSKGVVLSPFIGLKGVRN